MTELLDDGFAAGGCARTAQSVSKRKRGPTVAMRVSEEEKAALERAAGKSSVNAYLRSMAFGAGAVKVGKPARTRGRKPVEDWEALGRVLATLGRSGIPDALERLRAASKESPYASPQSKTYDAVLHNAVLQACADIAAMRVDLVKALGLQAKSGGGAQGSGAVTL